MEKRTFEQGAWSVTYTPDDGARLDRLTYNSVDLLTTKPASFKAPQDDYGLYETRPVYGYDDCFPSVEECLYPDSRWNIPDHGELCWLSWEAEEYPGRLLFSVKSEGLPLLFKRELHFTDNVLLWVFEVQSLAKNKLFFQHVIHPLMPLASIRGIELPEFECVFDEINQRELQLNTARDVQKFLLEQPAGTANMLFLRKIRDGGLRLKFKAGFTLQMNFPRALFPTIGIWWNNSGYPDEEGLRRTECAFEPIPGSNSRLTDAFKEGSCLSLPAGKSITWEIEWRIV